MSFIKRLWDSSKVTRIRAYFKNILINGITMSYLMPLHARRLILNVWGCKIKGTILDRTVILSNKLFLGEHSFINRNCMIGNGHEYVKIGTNCAIAYGVTFTTDNHLIDNKNRRGGGIKAEPIVVEDGCWIGANVTILPGTVIKKGCVVAAGSVVRGVLEQDSLYAGIPARKIKEL